MLETVRTIYALREQARTWQREGRTIGMVPTMGALHEGHLSLVRTASEQTDQVVVTLFVNPTQFEPHEDLTAYPRDEDADRERLSELGVRILFAPSVEEMYPAGFSTEISVGGPATDLETRFRPNHFVGVATVVTKLLLAGLPDRAFFGEKDFQQLLVVKKLVRDLNIPTEIVGCPTLRAPDGLALSSRNAYLSVEDRRRAPGLNAVMRHAAETLRVGDQGSILSDARAQLEAAGFAVDYIEARNAHTLRAVVDWQNEPIRLLAAARLGRTRLIDNIAV